MFKDIILSILTLGIYPLVSKARTLKQSVEKTKYRKDGTVKKHVGRDTEYSEDEAPQSPKN